MQILIVTESREDREELSTLFHSLGFGGIQFAAGAEDAWSILRPEDEDAPEEFDLLLCDMRLPDSNGVVFSNRLHRSPYRQDLPVILLYSTGDEIELDAAFAAGVFESLPRPFERSALLARINSAMRYKREVERRRLHERELIELTLRLREANDKLQRLAIQDDLTGIANRRHFDAFMELEWKRNLERRQPIALILADVDDFKNYNDRYGHQVGDNCLRQVAATLRASLQRPGDLAARYGGEEFVLVLPGTDVDGARVVAEKVRRALADRRMPHEGSTHGVVTASLGVAVVVPSKEGSVADLIRQADSALYGAKNNGRNRVEVALQPPSTAAPQSNSSEFDRKLEQ